MTEVLPEKPDPHSHFYAVIMAGGSGTRLWPLSRKALPKQFHNFVSDTGSTLLEDTWKRVRMVFSDTENIFIGTGERYREKIHGLIPEMSADHCIIEPIPRGTAAAIALAAQTIFDRDPDAVIATIASDHAIANDEEFVSALLSAFETASKFPEKIVTLGINPTEPDTGFGYIKMGEDLGTICGHRVFSIDAFKEKPDRKTAEEYLRNWEYLWNAGYFIFSARTFLKRIRTLTPTLFGALQKIKEQKSPEAARVLFEQIPNEAVEPAIIEKLPPEERAVIPAPLEWSDVGNWSAIFNLLQKQHGVSVVACGNHVDIGSEKCLVLSDDKKLIATVGLKNIVVVETNDCILIANKEKVSNIKNLLEKIKQEKGEGYL